MFIHTVLKVGGPIWDSGRGRRGRTRNPLGSCLELRAQCSAHAVKTVTMEAEGEDPQHFDVEVCSLILDGSRLE